MSSIPGVLTLCLLAALNGAGPLADEPPPLRLTVLYDNRVAEAPTQADWGFAALVESGTATVLFDTGTKPGVLRHNLSALGVDLAKVDAVVLSHDHGDHTGGLATVLERNHDLAVHVPTSFTPAFATEVEGTGARVVRSPDRRQIADNVWVTAETGDAIVEQALVVETENGLVLITGCAHPGIVDMVRATGKAFAKPVRTVLGGFHLLLDNAQQLATVIEGMRALGVESVGATHCSGPLAADAFRKAFGERFIDLGTGRVVVLE